MVAHVFVEQNRSIHRYNQVLITIVVDVHKQCTSRAIEPIDAPRRRRFYEHSVMRSKKKAIRQRCWLTDIDIFEVITVHIAYRNTISSTFHTD